MIRLRIGQRWKHGTTGPPVDSLRLEVEGVDLLPGASEERLDEVLPSLVGALHALATGRQRLAQVSFPEAHLELALTRRGESVGLAVVSLARPARRVRPDVELEAAELGEAVARGLRPLLPQLRARGAERWAGVEEHLAALERAALERGALAQGPERAEGGFRESLAAPPDPLGFAAELEDPEDLLRGGGTGAETGLASLLFGGSVRLVAAGRTVWSTRGVPFLLALELSRQGRDVLRALAAGEPTLRLQPGGVPPELTLDLAGGQVRHGGEALGTPQALAAAMFELGLGLAAQATRRSPAQARNPYLVELQERCAQGLAQLRHLPDGGGAPEERGGAEALPPRRPPRRTAEATGRGVLEGAGALRRLHFERRWERVQATEDPRALLLLGPDGPVVVGRDGVHAFGRDGTPRYAYRGRYGVATAADGRVVAATGEQLRLHTGAGASARWFRDDDGLPLGPELLPAGEALLVLSQGRILRALAEATGRELWRLQSPGATRVFPSVPSPSEPGARVLVATDAGLLHGLDLQDGRQRFRIRAPLPFTGPAVAWGDRVLALLNAGERTAVWAGHPGTGASLWTRELALSRPTPPLLAGGRIHVAGMQGDEARVAALDARGEVRWERPVPLGPPPLALAAHGRAVLAVSADGTAVRLAPDGRLEWRLGTAGAPLPVALTPAVRRAVALVPGPVVRAVDARGGRVLAVVETDAPLRALAVDARLTLYLLDEDGTLTAHHLTSHLGVVDCPARPAGPVPGPASS